MNQELTVVLKNPNGKYFLDTYSSTSIPYRVDLLNKRWRIDQNSL